MRALAAAAIRARTIPSRSPRRMFGSAGSGTICTVCGEPVRADQLEIDIDFNEPRSGHETSLNSMLEQLHARPEVVTRYHLHTRCFAAWEFERPKVGGPQQSQDRPI